MSRAFSIHTRLTWTGITELLDGIPVSRYEDCWNWTKKRERYTGIGVLRFGHKKQHTQRARLAFYRYVRNDHTIRPGFGLFDECGNPKCCNPLHMVELPRNQATYALTKEKVLLIRSIMSNPKNKKGMTVLLSLRFGVCKGTISLVANRKIWNHV